jgi:hypothetical protein
LISFFPNPVIDKLNYSRVIDLPIDRVEITNILGQNAIEVNYPDLKEELNLSSLTPGIYILNILSNKQKLTYKIIKQ